VEIVSGSWTGRKRLGVERKEKKKVKSTKTRRRKDKCRVLRQEKVGARWG
jgi:FtsZ-interacting cell division protein ZipA